MKLYLEIAETNLPPMTDVGVFMRVLAADEADARAKATVLLPHFSGLTYEIRLHEHYTGKPCVSTVIAL